VIKSTRADIIRVNVDTNYGRIMIIRSNLDRNKVIKQIFILINSLERTLILMNSLEQILLEEMQLEHTILEEKLLEQMLLELVIRTNSHK